MKKLILFAGVLVLSLAMASAIAPTDNDAQIRLALRNDLVDIIHNHTTSPLTMNLTNPNWDFNDDNLINAQDQLILRSENFCERDNETLFGIIYTKLMNDIAARLGLNSSDGNYIVVYDVNRDDVIDSYDEGRVSEAMLCNRDIPVIPEFGFIAGTIAIAGAVGLFFFVRRK
jgi:hypothetical protein